MDTEPVDACSVNTSPQKGEEQTIEEHLNERITNARKQVEQLCVLKAKVETLQMLKYPISFIHSICW